MEMFKRFLLFLCIGSACSLIPFMHISLIICSPAVLLNSIILTFVHNHYIKKEQNESN